MENVELIVEGAELRYLPSLQDGVSWETQRKNTPGKLTFSVYRDGILKIEEGNLVRLSVDGTGVFTGYVFTRSCGKDPIVNVTAYDQMRYLKNKDTYIFKKKKASQIISKIGKDYGLHMGVIADTGFKITSRVEENTTLFDMMQSALDITTSNTRQLYVLYDLNGLLTLTNSADMQVGLVVDAETAESYTYDTSIDSETYNRIKLSYKNDKTGKRKIFTAQDAANMGKWGTLQYYEELSSKQNAKKKAKTLLSLYNRPKKNLRINGVLGDLRVRAGCYIIVHLDLGDTVLNNFMMVEKCTHQFSNNEHRMNLELSGGDFSA